MPPGEFEQILAALAELKAEVAELREKVTPNHSPWLRGDKAAAEYAGYKSAKSFRKWARASGIRPSVDDKLNFWSRADIFKAREKGKW